MTENIQEKIKNVIARYSQADDREVVAQLKQLLYEFELQDCLEKEPKSIADLVAENIQQLNKESHQNAVVKSGLEGFDRQFGGFHLGEFVVVGGRPGMGKTQLLINLSLNISATVPVLYVTLDLSEFLLTNRFISSVSDIPINNILLNNLGVEEKHILSKIGDEFAKRKLFIHDSVCTSITALKTHCQKQIKKNGIQVIVVDYLQIIHSHKHRTHRELEVSYICRELKNMAKEHNVCVIASSQLNRSVESRGVTSKRPQLFDLRDSGAIEQEADKVLFIYRPDYYRLDFEDGTPGVGLADIIVAKNRNGFLGECRLRFCNNFRDLFLDSATPSSQINEISFASSRDALVFASKRLAELDGIGNVPF